jgi:hypothetical protein
MAAIHGRFELVLKLFCVLMFLGACSSVVNAQGPCGGKPCPIVKTKESRKSGSAATSGPRPQRSGNTGPRTPRPVSPAPVCEDAELVVVCGMPGCEITLNGKDRSITDELGGITFQVEGNQNYRVRVTKPGYESYDKPEEKLGCAGEREVKASLKAKPVELRIRTKPTECDIYLDGQKQPKGSDAQGMFSYVLTNPTMLVEARKKGFLSATKNIFLVPELSNREIVLELDPISATVKLSANIENARVTVDNQTSPKSMTERIMLPPGAHTLTVEALGYTPVKLELTVGPDETVSKDVRLERLSPQSLQQQAFTAFNDRRYADTLTLCEYIFETDQGNAGAHRLAGLVYLERGDFGNAGSHLAQALAGGEPVSLRVRRHAGEKFDLNKGHDTCEARLILGKNDLEFQGVRTATDNFKVTYDQIQVIGIQLKNNVASYLGTKVNVGGKRHDFNFYSYDKELSQAGKPYLEMIQRLLRSH